MQCLISVGSRADPGPQPTSVTALVARHLRNTDHIRRTREALQSIRFGQNLAWDLLAP